MGDLRDSIDDEDEDGEDALGSSSEATRKSKKATASLASIAREEHDLELPVGTKVEAKAKGFKQHYPGVVDDVADDGTYSVTFEDGDHKSGIKRGDIIIAATAGSKKATRSLAAVAGVGGGSGGGGGGGGGDTLTKGTKVEAKAKGFKQHYPGTIDAVADDGTYSVTFEDGDHKSGIKRGDIIIAATAGSKKATRSLAAVAGVGDGGDGGGDTLAVGTKVEAKAKGFKQHYAGIVDAVAPDGTYSVAFEDGDHKSGIPRGDIRGRPSTTKPKSKTVGSRLANLAATTT